MAERAADYIDTDNWTCPQCGSSRVEERVWREVNGGAVTGDSNDDMYYCGNGCEDIDAIVEPGFRADYED